MRVSKRIFSVAVGILAVGLIALPPSAFAAHGKAGLWQVTMKMDMAGMPQMSPAQAARMRAMGMQVPMGRTITTTHCMTPAEVAADKPPPTGRGRACKMENMKITGQTFSGDMVCRGEMQGTAHMRVTYDSPTHYSGQMRFSGMSHGHSANMSNSFEGKWLSASCGAVH